MKKSKPSKLDLASLLADEKHLALYLDAFLKGGGDNHAAFVAALGNVARASGAMPDLAVKAGMTRPGLYKALGKNGNPRFSTVLKVMRSLNLELRVAPLR